MCLVISHLQKEDMIEKIKIMVVDDSFFYQAILTRILKNLEMVKLVGSASNGQIALRRIPLMKPDLITLDLEMPIMDGLETLRHLSQDFPEIGVIIVSSENAHSADRTIKALGLGCIEFIVKPVGNDRSKTEKKLTERLLMAINIFSAKMNKGRQNHRKPPSIRSNLIKQPLSSQKIKKPSLVNIVLIGASTGGPRALERVITKLPKNFHVAVLIVQHMPKLFTESLAKTLNDKSNVPVHEGKNLENILPGHVYIAPGGKHMTVSKNEKNSLILKMNNKPPENSCRPSVDALFKSAVNGYLPIHTLCVIMTGMGYDGLKGVKFLHDAGGGYCLTQSENSCTIYGMPRVIAEAGLNNEVIELDNIAERIIEIVHGKV